MSTTFGVKLQNEEGEEITEEIAFRSSKGIHFTSPLAMLLPDDLKVYPLDNTNQGIYCIGDIKKKIKEQKTG